MENKAKIAHVMIVDDEISVASYLSELLRLHDYNVTMETDCNIALGKLAKNPDDYSLIITDQTMPCFTGIELSQLAKEIKPGIPIILCSGYSEDVDENKALKLGVQKPFLVNHWILAYY